MDPRARDEGREAGELKSKHSRLYFAGKYLVGAAAVYFVFVRPLVG